MSQRQQFYRLTSGEIVLGARRLGAFGWTVAGVVVHRVPSGTTIIQA